VVFNPHPNLPVNQAGNPPKPSFSTATSVPPIKRDTQSEILRLKIEQARRNLAAVQARHDTGTAGPDGLQIAQNTLAILEAEAAGNTDTLTKVKLAAAERRVENAEERYRSGLGTDQEVSEAKTDLAILKLEMSDASESTPPSAKSTPPGGETHRKKLQLKISQAKRNRDELEVRYTVGVATMEELAKARDAIALLEADLAGNPFEIARIKFAAAERSLAVAEARYRAGLAPTEEVESIKTELAVLKLELDEAARANGLPILNQDPATHASPPTIK